MCQRLPLTSFLILPFQRITRLKMLVEVPRRRCCLLCLPPGHHWVGKVTGGGHCLPHCTNPTLQNILKRTAQGSEDEDMATKAFNALKEVSSVG